MEGHLVTNLEAEGLDGADPCAPAVDRCSGFYPTGSGDSGPSNAPLGGFGSRPSGTLGGVRVLVVEDDPDARELVVAILEDAGAVVDSAESAAAGFAAMRSFHPQLLVSDIGMPGEDGYSLIRRVRALGPSEGGAIPSIALTAYTRAEDRAKALGAGFTMHMGKPIKPTDLVSAIEALVAPRS
jgi:CheY-like chemotaxis protein